MREYDYTTSAYSTKKVSFNLNLSRPLFSLSYSHIIDLPLLPPSILSFLLCHVTRPHLTYLLSLSHYFPCREGDGTTWMAQTTRQPWSNRIGLQVRSSSYLLFLYFALFGLLIALHYSLFCSHPHFSPLFSSTLLLLLPYIFSRPHFPVTFYSVLSLLYPHTSYSSTLHNSYFYFFFIFFSF